MSNFEKALTKNAISKLMLIPKSDIHTHGGKGGRIKYYSKWANTFMKASNQPFNDLNDMQNWFNANIKVYDNGKAGYHWQHLRGHVKASLASNHKTVGHTGLAWLDKNLPLGRCSQEAPASICGGSMSLATGYVNSVLGDAVWILKNTKYIKT